MWLLGFVILTLHVFSQCSDELVLEAVFQGKFIATFVIV